MSTSRRVALQQIERDRARLERDLVRERDPKKPVASAWFATPSSTPHDVETRALAAKLQRRFLSSDGRWCA